jgi:hypothetical protein
MDPATKKAVDAALGFLAKEQKGDGSWSSTAITGLVLLAFMSNGHLPDQDGFGKTVGRGVEYLLSAAQKDGYLVGTRGGNMYCHALATLALTQFYAMTGNEKARQTVKPAVQLIIKAQNNEGGWRYDPAPTGADISITAMQVMALRAARDAGFAVPEKSLLDAVKYVGRCRDARNGGYRYQPYGGLTGFARTAAGVCALQSSGYADDVNLGQSFEFMARLPDDPAHYWYGHFHASHAYSIAGGKAWEDYYRRLRERLLAEGFQRPDGQWYDARKEGVYGPAYQTAIAVLILSIPTSSLPMYRK